MNDTPWVLLDTETNGLAAPIFVVEIGAQRMRGWQPDGPPFRRLLNQNADIPPSASRVHGFTREILERDGEPAGVVYSDFAAYVGKRPLVAYNLLYDLDQVLIPEWQRLGIPPIGKRGFCALRLAQRLLDPVPAGNCKLQTLRQFYRLPERGAHTAMGDVETVMDLIGQVLRPIAEQRNLHTWDEILSYTEAAWYPSRIAFGKFKGRSFREALTDPALRGWLEWLASSSNERSATMGHWYLSQLEANGEAHAPIMGTPFGEDVGEEESGSRLVLFVDPETEDLKRLVQAARNRLADIEAEYTRDRHAVDVTQARVFKRLRQHYQRRDRLQIIIEHRKRFLNTLLQSGEEEAEQVSQAYEEARHQSDEEYEQAAEKSKDRKALTEREGAELQALWRQLVKLFHPDRFSHDLQKKERYESFVAEINLARDSGDIRKLREIAGDPEGFLLREGMGDLDLSDATESLQLRKLLESLQASILEMLEALGELKQDEWYELHALVSKDPDYIDNVVSGSTPILRTLLRSPWTSPGAVDTPTV